jgi:hypothetical protein
LHPVRTGDDKIGRALGDLLVARPMTREEMKERHDGRPFFPCKETEGMRPQTSCSRPNHVSPI